MQSEFHLDPAKTAVLSMDLQASIVQVYARDPEFMPRVAGILRRAREAAMKIVHVQVTFRPGLPEVSPRNRLFNSIRNSPQHQAMFEGAAGAIHSAAAPQAGDIVVSKNRVSAFAGTDLDLLLRANAIENLVMFGIATSGVVLSTLLEATDRDYRVVVVPDCCADLNPTLHACLLEQFFPTRAEMVPARDFGTAAVRG